METQSTYTAFDGHDFFGHGALSELVVKIKKQIGKSDNASILIFSDITGKVIDFNFQGTQAEVLKRLDVFVTEKTSTENISGPGRPKLGVVSREISLLPQHWEWLANQPGGASAILRKLVDEAKRKSSGNISIKQVQERVHRFASAMAGDFPNFEEALRSLYRKDEDKFLEHMNSWPKDVRNHVVELAKPIFGK